MVKINSYKEIEELTNSMENFHSVFSAIWGMSRMIFTESVPTAAVSLSGNGERVIFSINPKFWQTLNKEQKKFTICHEALHVVFNHLQRLSDYKDEVKKKANKAFDIVVNHLLISKFGFKREDLGDFAENGCWVDTIFPDKPRMSSKKSSEYYLTRIGDGLPDMDSLFDNHDGWEEIEESDLKNMSSKTEDLCEGDNDLEESRGDKGGTGIGGNMESLRRKRVRKSQVWDVMIKDLIRTKKILTDDTEETWGGKSRRHMLLGDDLFLPSERIDDVFTEDKIVLNLFLDVSGSCYNLVEDFFTISESIPDKLFDINLFTFDEIVSRIPKNVSNYEFDGSGGTDFRCIERDIQDRICGGEKYPDAVFVITDGEGCKFLPERPERWTFFLTHKGCEEDVPEGAKIIKLKDVGFNN